MREEELLLRLREAFQAEAGERLSSLFANLAFFEKAFAVEARNPLIEVLFREAHSLKGAARAINLSSVEKLCQALESLFSLLKKHNPEPHQALLDLLYDSTAFLERLIAEPEVLASETGNGEFIALLGRLGEVEKGGLETLLSVTGQEVKPEPVVETEVEPHPSVEMPLPDEVVTPLPEPVKNVAVGAAPGSETLRISTTKLDELMLVAEEFISFKLAQHQHLLSLRGALQDFPVWEKEWGLVKAESQSLGRTLGDSEAWTHVARFFETNHNFVKNLERQIRDLGGRIERDRLTQSGLVDELLDRVKDVAMLPIETLFLSMPRMVRELGRELGKKVDFEFSGGLIEVDRRVLDEMKDPLIHLLRNAVDHGLETPEIRAAAGKDPAGRILCTVSQSDGSSIDITIVDDGQGIDSEKLKQKAIEQGSLDPQTLASLSQESLLELIFNSGFSTSSIITEISGRGLGMAIVREKIDNLGGRIAVSSKIGAGTTFAIHLPVSIAVCRGIRVNVSGREFIFPSLKVERVLRAEKKSVGLVEGRPTIVDEGQVVPLTDLGALLGLEGKGGKHDNNKDELSLVLVGSGDRCQALLVDEILGEQEILVKSLGKQLLKVPNIAGATILGSGKVVPILNVKDILENSAESRKGGRIPGFTTDDHLLMEDDHDGESGRRLLVVDDSITSRMLLQNILEASDYQVTTAVDGMAALTLLKSEKFDLVVSDVEMPRMGGFVLTENIRGNESLAEIPVVLVTSLGSREDRERGVAAGANAYIVKGEFDQNNLLQVIERLL
ncbi:MAG: hybrid sensor histidine kinase/response regulator [Deltaproteobacteria bacterium]|nr:hybrid sensor histidine kinase/response regulator [Deltaproteobacteria bacterium]